MARGGLLGFFDEFAEPVVIPQRLEVRIGVQLRDESGIVEEPMLPCPSQHVDRRGGIFFVLLFALRLIHRPIGAYRAGCQCVNAGDLIRLRGGQVVSGGNHLRLGGGASVVALPHDGESPLDLIDRANRFGETRYQRSGRFFRPLVLLVSKQHGKMIADPMLDVFPFLRDVEINLGPERKEDFE